MADNELSGMLSRRIEAEDGKVTEKRMKEYRDPREEFAHDHIHTRNSASLHGNSVKNTRKCLLNVDLDGFIDYDELKMMMEKRGEPLTHLELTKLIKEVDEDKDGKLCFREFMLIWQKCLQGMMPEGSGFAKLVEANKTVLSKPGAAEKAGVGGASNFWEHKGSEGKNTENYEEEIREEQRKKNERKREAKKKKEAEAKKKAAFEKRAAMFGQ